MKRQNIPDGWGYEGDDPTVGIFGEEWFHEDCPLPTGSIGDDDLRGVIDVAIAATEVDSHGMVRVQHVLTCQDCGDEARFDDLEFMGFEEELDEVGYLS